jgi:VIT1/CCC1 family predicted Fe2+/Mn2+ transporter
MAASEYLSRRSDGESKIARIASVYTGITYIVTVMLLIAPFLIMRNQFVALATSVVIGLGIILAFNFYLSIARGFNFKKRSLEMATLSLGIAGISFGVGWILKLIFGVSV